MGYRNMGGPKSKPKGRDRANDKPLGRLGYDCIDLRSNLGSILRFRGSTGDKISEESATYRHRAG